MQIEVNYHSSVLINDSIYIDPLNITKNVMAQYVFITHPHWDHFSINDINKIITKNTQIICPLSMKDEINNIFDNPITFVQPNQQYTIDGLKFSTIPSYNLDKQFHLKQYNWVGYVLDIKGVKVTITGDTDLTPELKKVKTDILLLPIGGTFTMDYKQAAQAVNIIKPKKVIPVHYGEVVGNAKMAQKFKQLINKDIECEIQI